MEGKVPGVDVSFDRTGKLIVSVTGTGYQIEEKESYDMNKEEEEEQDGLFRAQS